MFKVKFESGTVVLPDPFKIKVKNWLGNNEKAFQEIYDQVKTCEPRVFTPLPCHADGHLALLMFVGDSICLSKQPVLGAMSFGHILIFPSEIGPCTKAVW